MHNRPTPVIVYTSQPPHPHSSLSPAPLWRPSQHGSSTTQVQHRSPPCSAATLLQQDARQEVRSALAQSSLLPSISHPTSHPRPVHPSDHILFFLLFLQNCPCFCLSPSSRNPQHPRSLPRSHPFDVCRRPPTFQLRRRPHPVPYRHSRGKGKGSLREAR